MWLGSKVIVRSFLVFAAGTLLVLVQPLAVFAATTNPQPAARISFTFDDGYTSAITQAAPTLAKYGIAGTSFVVTGCVGMTKAPNTCQADRDATYMSLAIAPKNSLPSRTVNL